MTQWYYARGGQQSGPVSLEELRALVQSGQVGAKDLVWNSSMADWLPAGTVSGLMDGAPAVQANPYSTPGSAFVPASMEEIMAPAVEIEPGSEPLEVMSCISRGFELTKRHFLVLFLGLLIYIGISIAINIPFNLAGGISQLGNPGAPLPPPSTDPMEVFRQEFQRGMHNQFSPLALVQQAVSMLVAAFIMAGFTRITLNIVSGAPAEVGQLFSQGRNFLKMFAISILFAIPWWIGMGAIAYSPTIGGFVMPVMFLVTVVIWVRLGFAGPAIVDRNMGIVEALKYSASITRNNSLKVLGLWVMLCLLIVAGVFACCVGLLFTAPLSMVAIAVAYRWLQYGRRAVLDYPGTTRPLLSQGNI